MSRAAAQEIPAEPEIGLGGPPAVCRPSVGTSASMCTPFARSTTWPRRSSHPHPASPSASRAGPVIRSPTTTRVTPVLRFGEEPRSRWTASGLTTETPLMSTGTSMPSTVTTTSAPVPSGASVTRWPSERIARANAEAPCDVRLALVVRATRLPSPGNGWWSLISDHQPKGERRQAGLCPCGGGDAGRAVPVG